MTTERTDHAAEARNLIEVERTPQSMGWETADAQHLANLAEAQVHATLALVEQQRAANLIAVMSSGARGVAEGLHAHTDYLELHQKINPEVRALLGLEGVQS